jgi:hypothetical protein
MKAGRFFMWITAAIVGRKCCFHMLFSELLALCEGPSLKGSVQ